MYFECFERGLKAFIIIETKGKLSRILFLVTPAGRCKRWFCLMRTIETNWFKNASWEIEQCRIHIVSRSYLGLLRRVYGNEGVLFI